jgi:hypothetical protein
MPPMSARTAAELTGKDRSTILRAIETGRLSASKNDQGHYLIDPAELERVYGTLRAPTQPADPADAASHDAQAIPPPQSRELELLRESFAQERKVWSDTLEHERRQWDEERTFLRGMLERHTEQVRLLTDERQQKERHSPTLLSQLFRRAS